MSRPRWRGSLGHPRAKHAMITVFSILRKNLQWREAYWGDARVWQRAHELKKQWSGTNCDINPRFFIGLWWPEQVSDNSWARSRISPSTLNMKSWRIKIGENHQQFTCLFLYDHAAWNQFESSVTFKSFARSFAEYADAMGFLIVVNITMSATSAAHHHGYLCLLGFRDYIGWHFFVEFSPKP